MSKSSVAAKFSTEGYNISLVGKNVPITDALRQYVLEKISKIERITHNILEIFVTLEVQKVTQTVSIVLKFSHYQIKVHASTEDLYSSIDIATEKLKKLICKYKSKLQDHHKKEFAFVDMKVNVLSSKPTDVDLINDEIEAENSREEETKYLFHQVVSKEIMRMKTLTQDQAIMKLELSGERFLIFRSEEDKKISVVYRREDDNLGIIEVE
ncbi:MAG: ribosome-associated translation inhibitor RaiA [Chlamydiota bacterium]